MARLPLETFTFESFDGSRTAISADHRRLAPGSLNQIITGSGKAQAFKGLSVIPGLQGSLYLTNAGEGYAGLGSFGDSDIKGSVFRILSALFFVGNGALRFNGVSMGASAASVLQLKLLSGGTYAGVTYQAGLSQPLAPTIATLGTLGVGFTGKLKNGTYSAKAIKIRSSTGVRSVASLQSNIIVAAESGGIGKSARITFPAIGSNGADRWGIYVSARNFGSTGPHYFLQEVNESDLGTVDGVPRSIEIEWTDGDLGAELAPIDSFVPPAAVFGGVLGDTAFLDGCYGDVVSGVSAGNPGSTIVQSLPLRPEEYPPDFTIFPPEPPTALIRGGDGFFYRFGKSSMGVISNVGGEPALAFQLMWATTGISFPHNATVGTGGRLYAKCGSTGLTRIGADGEPETAWANPVADIIRDWDDRYTVLGWDGDSHSLVATNRNDIVVYNESLDRWGTPIDESARLNGDITAAVTHGNSLILAAKDDGVSGINLYDYNTGTGSLMEAKTDWHFSNGETDAIRQIDAVMRADNTTNSVQMDIYTNEDDTAPVVTQTLAVPKTGTVQLPSVRLMLPGIRSFAVKLTQQTTGGDAGFEQVRVTGSSNRITL